MKLSQPHHLLVTCISAHEWRVKRSDRIRGFRLPHWSGELSFDIKILSPPTLKQQPTNIPLPHVALVILFVSLPCPTQALPAF